MLITTDKDLATFVGHICEIQRRMVMRTGDDRIDPRCVHRSMRHLLRDEQDPLADFAMTPVRWKVKAPRSVKAMMGRLTDAEKISVDHFREGKFAELPLEVVGPRSYDLCEVPAWIVKGPEGFRYSRRKFVAAAKKMCFQPLPAWVPFALADQHPDRGTSGCFLLSHIEGFDGYMVRVSTDSHPCSVFFEDDRSSRYQGLIPDHFTYMFGKPKLVPEVA